MRIWYKFFECGYQFIAFSETWIFGPVIPSIELAADCFLVLFKLDIAIRFKIKLKPRISFLACKVNLFGNPIEATYALAYDTDIIAFQFVG